MNLHKDKDDFFALVNLASEHFNIPETAIKKDYYITLILNNLQESELSNELIFKGGTSLSKCYPESIARFSEDIDLTYIPKENQSKKQISNTLKQAEIILSKGFQIEKIKEERSDRNKSSFIKFDENFPDEKIKLEIGSTVLPYPYNKKYFKSYIHNFLELKKENEIIENYKLSEIEILVLDITRTFIDKVFAVKRHSLSNNLNQKERHIYDVVKLFEMEEIQNFLLNTKQLKEIVSITKKTDLEYLSKRKMPEGYDPEDNYNFNKWKNLFNNEIRKKYENLHKTLLYTNEKQDFQKAIFVFEKINDILKDIDE